MLKSIANEMRFAEFLIILCSFQIGLMSIISIEKRFKYTPTWNSLDTRPIPEWYDDDKIGIFMHYGVYSVPSFGSEWFWYSLSNNVPSYVKFMKKNYPKSFQYRDFAPMWKAEFFDEKIFAKIVKDSGAKYFILTTKHHEGFTLWKSNMTPNWNSVDIGPKKDFVELLTKAMRKEGIKVCYYFSLFEWFHPYYLLDKENRFLTQYFVDKIFLPQLYELVTIYQPDCIWADGDWEADSDYWKTKEFLAWLFNDSPVKDKIVVNDRWGNDCNCKHGSFRNCQDRYLPDSKPSFKWENAFTLDRSSWGYRRNAQMSEIFTIKELFEVIFETISMGGNVAINVGPTPEGTIPLIFVDILTKLGSWLKLNGESIYKTKPFRVSKETKDQIIWFTSSKTVDSTIYAFFLLWPLDGKILINSLKPTASNFTITLIGYDQPLRYNIDGGVYIWLPLLPRHDYSPAYTLKFNNFIESL